MILLFFTVPVILLGVGIYVMSYIVWEENKKFIALANRHDHQRFTDLKVSSLSYRNLKSIMGFEVKAQLFLLEDTLIIASQEMSLKLFHTTLPIVLENRKGTITKVVMTSWKTVQITFLKNTSNLGKATVEVTIETNDTDEQAIIFNHIKDWT